MTFCIVSRYTRNVIVSFRHKGLEQFFKTGSKRGIQPEHAPKLQRVLLLLDHIKAPHEVDLPGYRLHSLAGSLQGHWSIRISGNWRVTFRFSGEDVELLDYQDYH